MQTMILITTEAERVKVKEIWDAMKRDDDNHFSYIGSEVTYNLRENTDMLFNADRKGGNDFAIVYDLRDDGWHIYNFNTMREEVVEGDLAGLANSANGNFPFFN